VARQFPYRLAGLKSDYACWSRKPRRLSAIENSARLTGSNYGYYFIVSWLPFCLIKSRDFSMGWMVAIATWAYLLNALSALAMGWIADRWIRTGRSPR